MVRLPQQSHSTLPQMHRQYNRIPHHHLIRHHINSQIALGKLASFQPPQNRSNALLFTTPQHTNTRHTNTYYHLQTTDNMLPSCQKISVSLWTRDSALKNISPTLPDTYTSTPYVKFGDLLTWNSITHCFFIHTSHLWFLELYISPIPEFYISKLDTTKFYSKMYLSN